jgi:hypothetical protein
MSEGLNSIKQWNLYAVFLLSALVQFSGLAKADSSPSGLPSAPTESDLARATPAQLGELVRVRNEKSGVNVSTQAMKLLLRQASPDGKPVADLLTLIGPPDQQDIGHLIYLFGQSDEWEFGVRGGQIWDTTHISSH